MCPAMCPAIVFSLLDLFIFTVYPNCSDTFICLTKDIFHIHCRCFTAHISGSLYGSLVDLLRGVPPLCLRIFPTRYSIYFSISMSRVFCYARLFVVTFFFVLLLFLVKEGRKKGNEWARCAMKHILLHREESRPSRLARACRQRRRADNEMASFQRLAVNVLRKVLKDRLEKLAAGQTSHHLIRPRKL